MLCEKRTIFWSRKLYELEEISRAEKWGYLRCLDRQTLLFKMPILDRVCLARNKISKMLAYLKKKS